MLCIHQALIEHDLCAQYYPRTLKADFLIKTWVGKVFSQYILATYKDDTPNFD